MSANIEEFACRPISMGGLFSGVPPILSSPGGPLEWQEGVGIRLVHGLTKSTLITYFSGMKKDPKMRFLHAFF